MCVYVCVRVRVCVKMCARVRACACLCEFVHMCACVRFCARACVCVCVRVRVRVRVRQRSVCVCDLRVTFMTIAVNGYTKIIISNVIMIFSLRNHLFFFMDFLF